MCKAIAYRHGRMANTKIEGERLDVIIQKMRDRGEAAPIAGAQEFEEFLKPGVDRTAPQSRIEAQLVDYLMPIIKDGSIFQEGRTISLLEHLRDYLLPQWNGTPEMAELASRVIEDEIYRYRALRERRQECVAA